MRKILCKGALLAGALTLSLSLAAQPAKKPLQKADVAVLFSVERTQLARTGTPSVWLKGASIDASYRIGKGFGVAANFTGEHASDVLPGTEANKVSYLFGPRYTFRVGNRSTQIFGEGLIGGVRGFNSVFPGPTGIKSSANGFAAQVGGGIDVVLASHFGLRALEADWVHSTLPNNASNVQNNLRLAMGLTYRWN